MSWSTINAAFKAQLEALTPSIGRIHDYIRWSEETDRSADFKAKFMSGNPPHLRFWMYCYTELEDQNCLDSDGVIIRRYKVLLEGFHQHNDKLNTEAVFRETVAQVAEFFRYQDSTISKTCNTVSNIKIEIPERGVTFQGVACHYCAVRFSVEEILTQKVTLVAAAPIADLPPNPGMHFPISAIADALIATVANTAIPYAVADVQHIQFYRGSRNDPIYPANPRVDLPLIRLRIQSLSAEPVAGRAGTVADSQYLASFWLYHRQTPGEDHQRLLANKVALISKPFLGNFTPPALAMIPNLVNYETVPVITTLHNDLQHEWNHPAVVISVAEVQIKLKLRVKLC